MQLFYAVLYYGVLVTVVLTSTIVLLRQYMNAELGEEQAPEREAAGTFKRWSRGGRVSSRLVVGSEYHRRSRERRGGGCGPRMSPASTTLSAWGAGRHR